MSEAAENNGLINNGDGITFRYVTSVIENSYFAVTYAIQSVINEKTLYRKNYVSTFFQCLLDYVHVIPFLIHGNFNVFSHL